MDNYSYFEITHVSSHALNDTRLEDYTKNEIFYEILQLKDIKKVEAATEINFSGS